MKLPPDGTRRVWAGSGQWPWSAPKIRMWTVPANDCIAQPTQVFYTNRWVLLSNEGNRVHQRWVALDRYNDVDWVSHRGIEAGFHIALTEEERRNA